jgi:hypothetical protein
MHPLEGSCQEAILPLPPLWTTFFCGVPSGTLPPPCGRRRIPVFFRMVSAVWRRTIHPSGSRPRDVSLARQTSAPGTCRAPENRRFPAVSNRVLLKCHGSLKGPVAPWLTAEASSDSTLRWQAICHGLRSGRIKRMVANHISYPSLTPPQLVAHPQPKAL